ncbi:MAG: glycosyltransferase [Ardenticatenia bacterium]|nr:glycosyltransferase [Ardenticatenia bacterium]
MCVWERVVRACPKARLLVVGRGLHGEDRRFEAEVCRRRLANTVMAVGWVPPAELPALLAAADVAFYPMDDTLINRTKCPVKLADLLALGVPVVGEAVGQVAEYLAHGAGILVPSGDVDRSVTALLTLLRNPERARRVGRAGRERLTRYFAWSVQGERVEAFYREVLAHST